MACTPASAKDSRLEGHAILTVLAPRVKRFDVGEAQPFINNLVHGLDTLPVTVC
jgi:hypothetical protein